VRNTAGEKFMQITAVATAAGPMAACVGSLSPWRCLTPAKQAHLRRFASGSSPLIRTPEPLGQCSHLHDRQLTGPYRKLRKTYRLGLAGTNATSLATFRQVLRALTSAQQDSVLQTMDNGLAKGDQWKQISAKSFFALVLGHTMQGFYGDPRHGAIANV